MGRAQRWARGRLLTSVGGWLLRPAGVTRRELVLKEVRLFFRDTTQWSQLVLLAVLVVVYVPLHRIVVASVVEDGAAIRQASAEMGVRHTTEVDA